MSKQLTQEEMLEIGTAAWLGDEPGRTEFEGFRYLGGGDEGPRFGVVESTITSEEGAPEATQAMQEGEGGQISGDEREKPRAQPNFHVRDSEVTGAEAESRAE